MKIQTTLAVAFAMALGCGAAQSATLSAVGGPDVLSQQGQALSGSTAAQPLPNIQVVLGADYSVNDNITVRIAGATVGGATDANLAVAANISCSGAPDMILSYITRSGNDIFLRVTQKNVLNTVGVTCTVGGAQGIEVTAPSVSVLTNVTATWLATTAITNIPFDPVSNVGGNVQLASVIDQFRTTPAPVALNGVVNVNEPSLRTLFLTDDGAVFPGNEDTLTLSTLDDFASVTTGPIATLTSVVVALNGDFSHIDVNNNGCVNGELAGAVGAAASSGTPGATISANCQTITYTYTPALVPAGGVVHAITFGPTGKVISAPQGFTATAQYNYTGIIAGTFSETDGPVGAGAWSLNGFSAFIPYMPYATGISQIIYLTNKSAQTGAVTINGYNTAGVACNFSAGSVAGNRVTQLSGPIKAGFEACYGAGFDGRISFNITANIPGALAEVVSAYNVNGDRVQVINNSNGKSSGTYGGGTYQPTLGGSL